MVLSSLMLFGSHALTGLEYRGPHTSEEPTARPLHQVHDTASRNRLCFKMPARSKDRELCGIRRQPTTAAQSGGYNGAMPFEGNRTTVVRYSYVSQVSCAASWSWHQNVVLFEGV